MFRRLYGRPRHLSYNRNMSLLNQLPSMQNMMPFMNSGSFPGMTAGFPFNGGMEGWNQEAFSQNGMNMFANQGVPNQNFQGIPGFQGFPFQQNGMMGQNGIMPQTGFQNGMQQPSGVNGMSMFPVQGGMPQGMNMFQQTPFMNPYPTQNQNNKQQSSQVQSFMNQFKGQDGNVDMKKMMDTAGQMMNTVNQLNSMVKGIAATFKA